MKGKLLIEPGFEAGSLYCEGCQRTGMRLYSPVYCTLYDETLVGEGQFIEPQRCQQCLDAEKEDE